MANSKIEKKISGSKTDRITQLKYIASNIDSSIVENLDVWHQPITFKDKNDADLAGIYAFKHGYSSTTQTDLTGIQIEAHRDLNGTRHTNALRLKIDSNGQSFIQVTDPAKWRDAINAVCRAGDNMTGTIVSQPGPGVLSIRATAGDSSGIYVKKQTLDEDELISAVTIQTKSGGGWSIGNYNNENLRFTYGTKENIDTDTNSVTTVELTSEGVFTGKTNYLSAPAKDGYDTDVHGNFISQTTATSACFVIQNYNGDAGLRYYWQTGELTLPLKPLGIGSGGTGATSAAAACTNIGAVAKSDLVFEKYSYSTTLAGNFGGVAFNPFNISKSGYTPVMVSLAPSSYMDYDTINCAVTISGANVSVPTTYIRTSVGTSQAHILGINVLWRKN